MSMSKISKMFQYINYRMRVTVQDGRQLVGKFMAFDRHMNLVIGDCEEFRTVPKGKKNEECQNRRTLGLVLLRGEAVVSMTVEGPPPSEESRAKVTTSAMVGPGLGRSAGRGIPPAPLSLAHPGLGAPVHGVGGPTAAMMRQQVSEPPMNYPTGQVVRPPFLSGFQPPQQPMVRGGLMPSGQPQFATRPGGPPPFPGPPPQFQRPMVLPLQMVRGPPPPHPGMQPPQQPPRPGMPPPPGGGIPVYGPPRPGMPPPPPNQQQQQ